MEWPALSSDVLLRVGLLILFFWGLVGLYAYREAKQERRSSPVRRGQGWGAIGLVCAVDYLVRSRERRRDRLGWLTLSVLLVGFWAVATIGRGDLDRAFHAWAALFAGLFVLYWQFDVERVGESEESDQ